MTKMKKLLALCLSIMMIISALPLTAGAAEEVIKFRAGYKQGRNDPSKPIYSGYADIPFTVTVDGKDMADGNNSGVGNIGQDEGAAIVISNNRVGVKLNYEITTENTGIFKVDAEVSYYGNSGDTIHVYVNDEEVFNYAATQKGYCSYPNGIETIGYIYAKAGETFKLSFNNLNTVGATSGQVTLRDVVLTLMPDPTFEGASIGATVNKSTDVITLDYSAQVTTNNAVVTLKNGDNELDITTKVNEADNTKLDIILNESLDYEKDYVLSFKNITMASGFAFAEEEVINFSVPAKAEDESAKTDTLVIDSLEIDGLTFTLKGTVTGSVNQAIKGRDVNVSFVFPVSETPKALDAVKTDADGKFEVTYTLSEEEATAEGGLYTFTAETEFASDATEDSVRYISEAERTEVLGTLESLTTAEEVANFFTENDALNADILGVDLETLAVFGDNVNNFYTRLADATYAVDGKYELDTFANIWEDAFILEDINLAEENSDVEKYLTKKEFREETGIDEAKYSLVDTQMDAFVTAVKAIESQKTMADFGKEVNKLFNDILALEFGKSDLTITMDNEKVYTGKTAYVDIAIPKTTDIKSYTIDVVCPDKSAAKTLELDVEIDGKANGTVTKETDDVNVTFTVTDLKNNEIESFGKLVYSDSKEGSYEFEADGTVVYEVDGVEINCVIKSDKVKITTEEKGGKSQGSSSSNFTTGGTTVAPVVKPVVKEEEVNQIGDGFKDLGSVEWAQDSIDYLYKKGIIADSADGMFRPNDSVTRAEFVKMLVTALRITDKTAQVNLSDVSQSDWYYTYVSAAVNYGLVLGDDKGNFRPNDRITRQDICVIVSRAMDKLGYGKADTSDLFYDDYQIASYAKDAVYRMRTHGIVNGMGDGNFAPAADATRAATAKIIFAFMKEANI